MVWSACVASKYQTSAGSRVDSQLRDVANILLLLWCFYLRSSGSDQYTALSQTFCCTYWIPFPTFFLPPPPFFFPAYYWFRLWFIYLFIFSLSVSDVPAVPLLYGAGDVHKAITSESSCILPSCEVCLSSVGLYCRLNAKPFFNDKNNCSLGKMLLSFTSSRN